MNDNGTAYLEQCPICKRLVLKGHHGQAECERLSAVRSSMRVEIYEASDMLPDEILRIHGLMVAAIEEHERTCSKCSELISQDRIRRCGEGQRLRDVRAKWGKRHDDAH
jgi:hypothetical protein